MKKKYFIVLIFIISMILAMPVFAEKTGQKAEIKNLKLISENEAKFGDILYFDFDTTGEVDFATVTIRNKEVKDAFALVPILNHDSNTPQIDLANFGTQNIIPGDYYISDVFLNPDDSSKYVHYSLEPKDDQTKKLNYNIQFTIKDANQKPELKNLKLTSSSEVKFGEKLYFEFETTGEVNFATVTIRNKEVKDAFALVPILNRGSDTPQIDLSYFGTQNVIAGDYYISDVYLNPDDSNKYVHYSLETKDEETKKLNYNIEFTITDEFKLNYISLVKTENLTKDNIYFNIDYNGEVSNISIVLFDKNNKNNFIGYLNMETYQLNPQTFDYELKEGQYYVSSVTLFGNNGEKISYYGENIPTNQLYLDTIIEFTVGETMKLNGITLKSDANINFGENLKFEADVSGEISYISCCFRNKETGKSIIGYLNNSFTEIDVTKMSGQLVEGEYYLSDVFLTGNNTKVVHYSNFSIGEDIIYLDSKVEFNVIEDNALELDKKIELLDIRLKTEKVKRNEKVYVEFDTSELPNNIMLSFFNNDTGDMLAVYLKDVETAEPYFIIPTNTKPGNYELNYAILEDFNGNETHYRKAEQYGSIQHFDFNYFLEIEKELNLENNILNIDNEKIDDETLKQIKELDSNISININTNNNSIVSANIFETIKGENKVLILNNNNVEWIFNGNDIKESKTIDTRVNVFELRKETNSNISEKLKNGIVLEFASNGQLPGKCLIRLKHNKGLEKELNNNIKLYYYNEKDDTIEKLDTQVIITKDNYYEFYIDHNSKYILSEENIQNEAIIESNQELINVNNKFLNTANIIKIIAIIICVVVLILIFSKKILANRKKNKEE